MTFGYPTNFRFGSRIGFPQGSASAPPFSPADVAGLYLWLKADAITGLNDGDAVATWVDSSGNGRDAVQIAAGQRPVYKTGIANGLPVVRFDGTDDRMNIGLSALTEAEAFVVVKLDNDPPTLGEGGLWKIGSAGDNIHIPFTDGTIYDDFGATARKTTVNPATSMSATFVIYSAYSATNDWQNYLNGVSLFSTATNTTGFNAVALIGSGGTSHLDGDLAEFIFYSNKLSAGDRAAVITYIQDKYAL